MREQGARGREQLALTREQLATWLALTTYLAARLQSDPLHAPDLHAAGRSPDLDQDAAETFCATLDGLREELYTLERGSATSSEEGRVQGTGRTEAAAQALATVQLSPGGEVLLTAGALASPHLLQLSGIGDPSVLAAAGVPVRLASPAVGQGVQDHPAVTVAYECSIRDGLSEIKPWMPHLNLISPLALARWALGGCGILATTFCDHGAFVRSSATPLPSGTSSGPPSPPPSLEAKSSPESTPSGLPDVQLRFVPGIGPAADGVRSYELLGKGIQHKSHGFTLQVINCRPRSVGYVRLVSANPSVAPEIRLNYLEAPEDEASLSRGIALARQLARTGALGQVSLDEVYPGAHVQSSEDISLYIASTLHSANGLSGGCCLGRVVDAELKVIGVQGLRVADASVMPRIPGAQLALPTTALAERAAKLIIGGTGQNCAREGSAQDGVRDGSAQEGARGGAQQERATQREARSPPRQRKGR